MAEWLEVHRRPASQERDKEISSRLAVISRFLPEPVKAQEFLTKFSVNLLKDSALLAGMEAVVRPDISCGECASTTSLILKKLGQPIMTNLYYNTVKMLLERISSVMVDKQALKVNFSYLKLREAFVDSEPITTRSIWSESKLKRNWKDFYL